MRQSFSAEKGMNGSKATAMLAQICRAVLRMVATRAMSPVLATFQGSVSCRYLLPRRAMFIASRRPSRRWKFSMLSVRAPRMRPSSSKTSRSMPSSSPAAGTRPPKYLCVSTTARLTKLPRMATSSLLLRVWKSAQVKSLSFVSGALAVRT